CMLELLRVSRRPRRSYASARVRGFSKCPCANIDLPTLREVFDALDMPHAEAMHASMHAGDLVDWTAGDWTIHIAEEQRSLFPALRAVGAPPELVDELEADHDFYGPILEDGGALPRGDAPHSLDAHGALEDILISEYAPKLIASGGAAVAKVGAAS